MSDPPALERIRSWFPVTQEKAYLFNGNIAPCAVQVRAAIDALAEVWSRGGDEVWAAGWAEFEEAKRLFAALVRAGPETLCSIPNTSTGINLAARMVDPKPGSNVVVHELSHQGSVFPWLQMRPRGVEVRFARATGGAIPLEELERLVDERTAAVSICHVSMGSGFRFDLGAVGELARRHGAAVVVDAAQSAGAVPIDQRQTPVDFLAAPTFKWLLGPLGAGFLHVREDWIERSAPPLPGWLGAEDPEALDLSEMRPRPGALRFESGVLDLLAWAGARAGLALLHELGEELVHGRIRALADRVYAGLAAAGAELWTPADPAQRAGIVAFDARRRVELHARLESRGIHVGNWQEHIRVDPSFYNTEEEVDRLLDEVGAFLADELPG